MARRDFGATWWGAAWLNALEQRALEDPNRLPRGRTYARQDRVTELEISPGLIQARVWGTDRYATQLSVRLLTNAEWDRVLDTIMEQAANAAALLAGEVPQAVGDLVLPDRGDLGPDCNCPDWAEPCKHAAALCYAVADVLDVDPFALLTLRGRGRNEVLAEVRQRRSRALGRTVQASSQLPRGADPGTPASAAFKRSATGAPDDTNRIDGASSRPVPRHPAGVYRLAVAPPADSGVQASDLRALVADAADRAWRMLVDGEPSGLAASASDDVVRRAARGTDDDRQAIAAATGLAPDELSAAAAAWRVGGRRGYQASRARWQADPAVMQPGVAALDGVGDANPTSGSAARVRANRVSAGPLQLRLDEHGDWWRFDADDELGWLLSSGPANDPAELL